MTETPDQAFEPPEWFEDPRTNPDLPAITAWEGEDDAVPPPERLSEEPETVEVADRGQDGLLPRELRGEEPEHPSELAEGAFGRVAPGVAGISLLDYSRSPQARGFGPPCKVPLAKIQLRNLSLSVNALLAEPRWLIMAANEAQGYLYCNGDTGCYNCRPVAGTSSYSWHSWAVAIDACWRANPQRRPVTTNRPRWELDRWNRFGFAWGGDYTGGSVPDAMHTEYMGTVAQIQALLILARAELLPIINGGAAPTPTPAPSGGRPPVLRWPWPLAGSTSHRIGLITDPRSYVHGGDTRYDGAPVLELIENVQRWLIFRGCTPIAASRWASSTWADRRFEGASVQAMSLWHSRFYPGQEAPGECWADDYRRLTA